MKQIPGPETGSVAERVAAHVERLIAEGVLKEGDRLPSERRLCDTFSASRSAVREGLRLLRGAGLVETIPGSGRVVAKLAAAPSPEPLLRLFRRRKETLLQLLEVRAVLEGEAARLAATRALPVDRLRLRRAFHALQAMPVGADAAAYAACDSAFHHALYHAARNPVLTHALRSLAELTDGSIVAASQKAAAGASVRARLDEQHRRIYEAVTPGDGAMAEAAAREHIGFVRSLFAEQP